MLQFINSLEHSFRHFGDESCQNFGPLFAARYATACLDVSLLAIAHRRRHIASGLPKSRQILTNSRWSFGDNTARSPVVSTSTICRDNSRSAESRPAKNPDRTDATHLALFLISAR
jgi:hypothetical protein